ncbi:SRPBCC family protein [Streptomyces sp. NPDC002221]|uniref:SRPBCC family protein n=1 Tax=Streptomyces sp. NPDC002221 TaxID=3364639 RepID=UPI0036AB261D
MPEQTSNSIKDRIAGNPAAGRLKEELGNYLQTRAEHAVSGLGEKLGNGLARMGEGRSSDGDGSSGGLMNALAKGGKVLADGGSPAKAALSAGGGALKDKVTGLFSKGKGKGGGGSKSVNIVEDIDVGVPVREAYDQWTQFQEFSTFAKGVVSVEKSDDTSSNWRVKVAKSTRSWKANVTEQIPDERIAWTTDGAKGTVKGVVTFHPITDNLTRVLLNLEYFPQGLFEKTGNIWRAQGRRARLDLKLYRKFIMMRGEATDGWRGEIRDGEVVVEHDDAVAREENGDQVGPDEEENDGHAADSAEDVDEYADEYADDDAPDDGTEGDAAAEHEDEDEDADDVDYDDYEDADEDADEGRDGRPARARADDDEYEQDELPEGHGDARTTGDATEDDEDEDEGEFDDLDDEDLEDAEDDGHPEDDVDEAERPDEDDEQPRRRRTASRR